MRALWLLLLGLAGVYGQWRDGVQSPKLWDQVKLWSPTNDDAILSFLHLRPSPQFTITAQSIWEDHTASYYQKVVELGRLNKLLVVVDIAKTKFFSSVVADRLCPALSSSAVTTVQIYYARDNAGTKDAIRSFRACADKHTNVQLTPDDGSKPKSK